MSNADELVDARCVATLTLPQLRMSSSTYPPRSNLPLLLRRCLWLLPLLNAGDRNLAARCLVDSLRAILERDPSPSLLPAIEVFTDCVVSSKQLRSFLIMANRSASEGSRMFTEVLPAENEHIVLELVCHHFISSLVDDGAFEVFLSALSWSGRTLQRTPEISFQGAFALVRWTCFFSLPVVVQAHILLLMSTCTNDQNLGLHIQVFQYAMNLYVRYLPALRVFNRIGGAKALLNYSGKERPFSCIKDTTEQSLRSQICRLLSFCELHSHDDLPINESDICSVIEENQHIFHEKFRQQCIVLVKGMLSSILRCAKQKEMLETHEEISDQIIFLAAALKVMGSSILHILHHFSQMRSVTDIHRNSIAHSKEYNAICDIISLLGQHEANELYRYDLPITVDSESASGLMLAHFASLLTCCLRRRLGFLSKGCIIMMMMATELIAEEESLGTIQLPMDVSKEVVCNTKDIPEVSHRTKETVLRYQRIQKSLNKGRHIYCDRISLDTPEECNFIDGKTNGQRYFECHPEYSPGGWDDILDFVECEEGKDYSNTLKQRQKFRMFKDRKWVKNRRAKRRSTFVKKKKNGVQPRMLWD